VPGFAYDEIAISGQVTDGAEASGGWTFDPASGGFHVTNGTETQSFYNAYFIENRQYLGPDQLPVGFDYGLYTAPYNFGGTVGPDWTERYSYQNGIVVWYYNIAVREQQRGRPSGRGGDPPHRRPPEHHALGRRHQRAPAHSGVRLGVRPPGDAAADAQQGGRSDLVAVAPGEPTFDDSKSYYHATDPADAGSFYKAGWASVKIPNSGTRMQVLGYPSRDGHVRIQLWAPRP
jgi:immune inhibitor A